MLNCCRSALLYALELRHAETIWLPDFMCDVVPETCMQANVAIKTYHIAESLLPDYDDFNIADGEYFLLCDYCGQLKEEDVLKAHEFSGGRLIVDETQGFFRKPWACADTLYTCRKYFGVADGGYLSTHDGSRLNRSIDRAESWDKMEYLLGRLERTASEFYQASSENNERFRDNPILKMSLVTQNILRSIDYSLVKQIRESNFKYLDEHLGATNFLKLSLPEGPFMYPYLVEDAEGIRGELAKKKIFIPTLWPNVINDDSAGEIARKYAQNILPLPVDQRYGQADMEAIISSLKELL